MARRRFFVDEVRDAHALLAGDDARHLARVLRAEVGQRYEISDNHSVYLAEIEALGKDQVRFRILEQLAAGEPPVRIALLAALIKFDRFEWMIEKATELGVETVIPVEAERSEKGLRVTAAARLERWRRIVRESSQQARRARLPEVTPPVPLFQVLAYTSTCRYFLEEQPGGLPLLAAVPASRTPSDSVALLVGPEGGWSEEERARAAAAGWTPVSLGPLILRAETAALAALAVLAHAWLR